MGGLLRGGVAIFALGALVVACARATAPASATGTSGPAAPAAGREGTQADPTADDQVRVNADARALADFEARVKQYLALHNKLEDTLPKLSKESTPELIEKNQRALGPVSYTHLTLPTTPYV